MKFLRTFIMIVVIAWGAIFLSCGDDNPSGSENHPPNAQYSPIPADSSTNVSTNADISWRASDPDANDVLRYDVYFDDMVTPVAEGHADTSYALGALDANTHYSWKIVAIDFAGDSAVGPVWGFTTGSESNQPPNAPYDPSPSDGATDRPTTLTLTWSCTDPNEGDSLSFDIYFGTTAFPSKVDSGLTEASYNPGTLMTDSTYYWKIVAFDSYGDSTVGETWYFVTGSPVDGIFAGLVVGRMLTAMGDTVFAIDELVARFDSAYAPCNPIQPLQAEEVSCNSHSLTWDNTLHLHRYTDPLYQPFIELGETYVFTVTGSSHVPALVDSIAFPSVQPYVTDPGVGDTVSLQGFDVTWTGSGSGSVLFIIMSGEDSTGVMVSTPNDGSYTFTNGDLNPINGQAGQYVLMMIYQNSDTIDVSGYDPRSFIWARIINGTTIYME